MSDDTSRVRVMALRAGVFGLAFGQIAVLEATPDVLAALDAGALRKVGHPRQAPPAE